MEVEKGVILIVYKQMRRSRRYLVLERKKNWSGWETPKGHLEEDDYEKTVKIELSEEAGIGEEHIEKIQDLDKTVSWEYEQEGKKFRKEYKAFAVEVDHSAFVDVNQNPDDEHEKGFFFGFEDASTLIEYDNNLELLETFHNETA